MSAWLGRRSCMIRPDTATIESPRVRVKIIDRPGRGPDVLVARSQGGGAMKVLHSGVCPPFDEVLDPQLAVERLEKSGAVPDGSVEYRISNWFGVDLTYHLVVSGGRCVWAGSGSFDGTPDVVLHDTFGQWLRVRERSLPPAVPDLLLTAGRLVESVDPTSGWSPVQATAKAASMLEDFPHMTPVLRTIDARGGVIKETGFSDGSELHISGRLRSNTDMEQLGEAITSRVGVPVEHRQEEWVPTGLQGSFD